jgi:hypothetical protein
MVDERISGFPPVTTPQDSDQFVIVQGGNNRVETRSQVIASVLAALAAHQNLAVLDHPTGSVTDAKIRPGAARSIIGRALGSAGPVADIAAAADNTVLARVGGILDWVTVTPAMIDNRTRAFFVPCSGWTYLGWGGLGAILPDLATHYGYGAFVVPYDYASAMTVTPVVTPLATGYLYYADAIYLAANGEAYNTHNYSVSIRQKTVTMTQRSELNPIAITAAVAGEYVALQVERQGGHASDTVNADVYLTGWKVSYTADS